MSDLERRVQFLERELERLRRELERLMAAQSKVESTAYQAGG